MADEDKSKAELVEEVKALREQLQEMSVFNENQEAYGHIVAHDLKHSLGLMIGYAEFLLEVYDGSLDDELDRDLALIARRGRLMVCIIEELFPLAYMRHSDTLFLVPVDMGEIVFRAQQRLSQVIASLDAEVSMPDSWPLALGREYLLEEVWVNFLGYALRYDDSERRPYIKLGATSLEDGKVRFWMQDNAPSLSAEAREKFLLPLPQSAQTKSPPKHRGLSIARYIVEKLGGEIGIEPGAPEGNVSFFTLPEAGELPETSSRGTVGRPAPTGVP